MSVNKLVPLPKKRITYKKGPNNSKYVYYVIRSYRNQKGNPTSDEKSIGKLDEKTNMLIPNRNYFDLFSEKSSNCKPKFSINVGYLEAFKKVSKEIGLNKILGSIFKEQAETIESLAAYMIAKGNIMSYYEDWIQSSCRKKDNILTSQNISKLFASLTEEDRNKFFCEWSKINSNNEYIAYDVTSISTYSENISIAEYGYNRDKEKLAQINLGMFVSEKTKIPLFYSVYAGSLIDKVHLPYMMELKKQISMERIRFVMDQGFVTQKNIENMIDQKIHILSLLPKNFSLYKEILSKQILVPHSSKDWIRSLDIYGYTIKGKLGEIDVTIYLYYDPVKASIEEENLYEDISRQEKVLELLKRQKKLKTSQTKYFTIEEKSKLEFTYSLDYAKIDEIKQKYGYFALISTDNNLNVEEALTLYRQRNVIEKSFDQLKNGMEYKRLHTHYKETTEGKIFIAFIGLIMRTIFNNRLKSDEKTKALSIKKVITELEKIQEIHLENGEEHRIPLTKIQKEILTALKVTY